MSLILAKFSRAAGPSRVATASIIRLSTTLSAAEESQKVFTWVCASNTKRV